MKFDMELEDILYTLKNKEETDEMPADNEVTATVNMVRAKADETLEPPKPKATEQPAPDDVQPEELIWLEGSQKQEADSQDVKPETAEKTPKVPFNQRFNEQYWPKLKKALNKRTLVIIGAVVLALVLVFGGVKIVQFSQSATLKKYAEQYGVEYPQGIRKEFYDAFGKNDTLAGNLVIRDTDTDIAVCSEPDKGDGLLEKGSSIYEEQHYRAIALSSEQADLEKVYATAEGYEDATQAITFRTLFGDEKYHVIAAYYTNTKPADDNGYLFPYNCYGNFTEDSRFQYQDRIKTRSLYDTGYLIQPEDICLTVSVDSDVMPAYRFVIVGVKVKKNVKRITTTAVNEEIHYPQSYCDMLGIHNRYWLAGHWYPEIYTDEAQTETKQLTIDDFQ